MSTALALAVVLFAVIVQVSVMPLFSIFGAHPNLLIVVLIAWMTARPGQEALFLIPAAGFALGLLDSLPVGAAMLALAPLVLMTEVRGMRLVDSNLLPAVGLTAVATLAYETIILLTLVATGDRVDSSTSLLYVLAPAVIANVLLLLPVYGAVEVASVDLRRRGAYQRG